MSNFISFILLAIIIIYIWIDIRRIFNKLGKLLGVDLEEIRDGVLEVEARVRRLEHHLLSRKQTEERDPLNFMDNKTGKPALSDKLIGATKGIIKDVRRQEIHKRIDPKGAEQVEKLESLREKMYGGEHISEDEIKDAFKGS